MHTVYKCFPQGKFKALTMSYDDGRTYDRKLVDIFNRHGIRGTFHLNSGFLGDERHIAREEVAPLYRGHEVAVHTVTHPTISRCPQEQVARQVLDDRQALEELVGYPVRGMSYPNGSQSAAIRELLPHLGIAYSRAVGDTDDFALPEDPYNWVSTCHHTHNLMENGEKFVRLIKSQYLYLMYVWGHSYEFNDAGNWQLMENFAALAGGREDTWYATNIEIIDCLRVLDSLHFSAKGDLAQNPSAAAAYLRVDGELVEVPGGAVVRLF